MSFVEETRAYEAWLGDLIQLDANELDEKHKRMQEDAFEFMRASFYRWAALWRDHAEDLDLDDAPEVLGVGDLHVENFGTWRDVDGRLAWGVNDFDEACPLPYVNDLVRLAVSAELALASEKTAKDFQPSVTEGRACDSILKGYTEGIAAATDTPDGRRPFVLAEKHDWLRIVAANKMEKKDRDGKTKFEKILEELGEKDLPRLRFAVPPSAREALLKAFPSPFPAHLTYRVGQRVAGLGSLGRQRFTAVVEDWNGGMVAREAKALAPSAWAWANDHLKTRDIWYETALRSAVRASDPWVQVHDGWVVRRLAPDAGKVKLDDLPPELDEKLLSAMGTETANVHSWSCLPLVAVWEDLKRRGTKGDRPTAWFRHAVDRMKAETLADWKRCQNADLNALRYEPGFSP